MDKKLSNCINCNTSIFFCDELNKCKDCNKIGICSFCFLTGFPYPNICLECIEKKKKISNQIMKNKLDIKKSKENKLNFYLYNHKL